MARKQNKSVKTPKKSSISLSKTKGGKVQKKAQESKAKKKITSQAKQALKTQGNRSKIQTKEIPTPSGTGRKSSRANSNQTKKSLTLAARQTNVKKVSTSPKAATSLRTNKTQPNKKTMNPKEQPESRKRGSTSSQNSNKNVTASTSQIKASNNMSLRGKKRSYAQLASGTKTDEDNVSKKRKTVDSKDITSRRSRSIKPTVKGSEWRNTILQKKSTSSQQESVSKTARLTPSKSKSPKTVNKSTVQKKKTPTRTPVGQTKTKGKTVTKPPKRQIGGKVTTQGIKNSPASQTKKSTKNKSPSKKLPENRSANKNSVTPQKTENDSTQKGVVTSIRNRYSSRVSNKRKSKDLELQENVLVAQGILNDILFSVGNSDILPNDKEFKVDENLVESDSLVEPSKEPNQDMGGGSKDDGETKSNHESTEVKGSAAVNKLLEPNPDLNEQVNLELHESVDVAKDAPSSNEDFNKEKGKNENEELEEMDLHLSYNSVASVSEDNLISTDDETNVNSINEKLDPSTINDELSGKVVDSNAKSNDIIISQQHRSQSLKSDEIPHLNGKKSSNNSTEDTRPYQEEKRSSQITAHEEKVSEQVTIKEKPSLKNEVLQTLQQNVTEISEPASENSSCLTSLSGCSKQIEVNNTVTTNSLESAKKDITIAASDEPKYLKDCSDLNNSLDNVTKKTEMITNQMEEVTELSNPISQSNGEEPSDFKKVNLKSKINTSEGHTTEKVTYINSNEKTEAIENCTTNEFESNSESNNSQHNDTLRHKTCGRLDLEEKTSCAIDRSINDLSPTHKQQIEQSTNIKVCKNESMNDTAMANGEENTSDLSDKSSLKIDGSLAENEVFLEKSEDKKEIESSDLGSGKIKETIPSNICLQKSGPAPDPDNKSKENKILFGRSEDEKKIRDFVGDKIEKNNVSTVCFQNDEKKAKENSESHAITNLKTEITKEKVSSKVKEVNSGKEISHFQNLENLNDNELKSKEMAMDKSSDQESADPFVISAPDTTDTDPTTQTLEQKISLGSENTSIDDVNSSSAAEMIGLENATDRPNIKDDSNSTSKHIATDVPEILSSVTSSTKADTAVAASNKTEELNINPSSPSEKVVLVENMEPVVLEKTSSSYHIESVDKKSISEDFQENIKTDDLTNLNENESKKTTEVSLSNEEISVGETLSHVESSDSESTTHKSVVQGSHPPEGVLDSNAEVPTGDSKTIEAKEELLKMEEGNLEDITQDSIIVDDTDGESMQCSSGTQSNRMSVDEENAGMEVDSDEITAPLNPCATIEMSMEVS